MGIPTTIRRTRTAGALALALIAACLAVALGVQRADAGRVVVLGAAKPAAPACGGSSSCSVLASVTGFQTKIGSHEKPFRVRWPGRIVAWSIKLSRPKKRDINCFTKGCKVGDFRVPAFGKASARLSILKPLGKKIKRGKPLYKLVRQSPLEYLGPYFGSTTTFTLGRPLKVGTGNIVALTTPSWAPAFAIGQGGSIRWRASRKHGKCADKLAYSARPHTRVGKARLYGCSFKGTRLLYSATLVKKPG
jgi:hypothetical protein